MARNWSAATFFLILFLICFGLWVGGLISLYSDAKSEKNIQAQQCADQGWEKIRDVIFDCIDDEGIGHIIPNMYHSKRDGFIAAGLTILSIVGFFIMCRIVYELKK